MEIKKREEDLIRWIENKCTIWGENILQTQKKMNKGPYGGVNISMMVIGPLMKWRSGLLQNLKTYINIVLKVYFLYECKVIRCQYEEIE